MAQLGKLFGRRRDRLSGKTQTVNPKQHLYSVAPYDYRTKDLIFSLFRIMDAYWLYAAEQVCGRPSLFGE